MRNITIQELVQWIIDHRSNSDAFKDYSHNKIVSEIQKSIKHNVFRLETNTKEEIIGVVCGEKFYEAKCILIHDILTTHPNALKAFWSRYLTTYPDWTLVAGHKGKMKTLYKRKEKV